MCPSGRHAADEHTAGAAQALDKPVTIREATTRTSPSPVPTSRFVSTT